MDDRKSTISKIVGLCQRVPGSTQWNAAEWMYDEMAARAALATQPATGAEPEQYKTDDELGGVLAAIRHYGGQKWMEGRGVADDDLKNVREAWDAVYERVQALARYGRPAGGMEPVAWTTPDSREPISDAVKRARPDLYDKAYTVALSKYSAPVAAQKADDARDAERWRWLRDLVCCSLTLSRNDDHACNYMTAEEWIRDFPEHFADCDPAEVERMMATNTIWRLQIYPNTPVGFNVWHGATPEAAIDAAIAQQRQGEGDAP